MKKYLFKPYSAIFPHLFAQEKKRLLTYLPDDLRVEHIGSTAVPDLGGKGIIDIAIGLENVPLDSLTTALKNLCYDLRESGCTESRLFYKITLPDPEETTRTYHLHVMDQSCLDWKNMLYFRDHLRDHPEILAEYAHLKQEAALHADNDGAKYRAFKESIFKKILH